MSFTQGSDREQFLLAKTDRLVSYMYHWPTPQLDTVYFAHMTLSNLPGPQQCNRNLSPKMATYSLYTTTPHQWLVSFPDQSTPSSTTSLVPRPSLKSGTKVWCSERHYMLHKECHNCILILELKFLIPRCSPVYISSRWLQSLLG